MRKYVALRRQSANYRVGERLRNYGVIAGERKNPGRAGHGIPLGGPCADCGDNPRMDERSICRECYNGECKTRDYEQNRDIGKRRASRSVRRKSPGYRAQVKLAGYGVEILDEELIERFVAPDAQCEICGVPNKFLWRLQTENRLPWIGGPHCWTRLSIDHIDPADRTSPDNLRPLCYHCNTARGDIILADGAVLKKARRFWTAQFPDRYLEWLK